MREVLFIETEPFPLEHYLPANFPVRRSTSDEICQRSQNVALVVLQLPREPHEGERLVRTTAGLCAPVFMLVPAGAAGSDVQPWLRVAEDFVVLPTAECELRERLGRLLALSTGPEPPAVARLYAEQGLRQLVGEDPKFLAMLQQIPRLAHSDATLLIQGASGTGKELVARAVHHLSRRRAMSFIAVDCGAFPDHLIENELFGHAAGAYTDARQAQKGLAALATGGTLFLDEIDALSLPAQAKVLRFVQERTFKPLGSERFERVDVKIVAATNRDLSRCVHEGRFRADLYYRLCVLTLELTPLCERRGDIPLLARHFLRTLDPSGTTCSAAAMRALTQHNWPGNARELQNVIQQALVMCDGPQIQVHHLGLAQTVTLESPNPAEFRSARASALAAFELQYLTELLRRHHGNVTQAARAAGKDRRALGRLIKKHRLDRKTG